MPKHKQIPHFKNEDEERNFWAKRSVTDYVDWKDARRVRFPNLKPTLRTISIRLPEHLIGELKYKENTLPLEHIGKLLYEEIIVLLSDILLFNADAEFLLIPIPISEERRLERGYNQSEYIAKAILENDVAHKLLYAPQWFSKIKETPSQSHSESKAERISNLAGCFEADPRVEMKYIILIDDVVTTGSTLSEARKTLLDAGARDVFAFTIAH